MVNTNLFGTTRGKAPRTVPTNEKGEPFRNEAGGVAFEYTPKHALAQYACTGTLSNTYYASDRDQLKKTLELVKTVNDPEFIGKLAVYARKSAFMKDMPSLLVAVLFARSSAKYLATDSSVPGIKKLGHAVEAQAYANVFKAVFPIVIDNARMLRNFVQIIRSGQLGRKSFGTAGKRAIRQWFEARTANQIFRASVGKNPSMADIISMARPKGDAEKDALYAYLLGAPAKDSLDSSKENQAARLARGAYAKPEQLPELVRQFEAFKADPTGETPKVDFRQLTDLELSTEMWRGIALNGRWHQTRMSLNTYTRHGCFEGQKGTELANKLAELLTDEEQIHRAMVFPYQLFMAYKAAKDIPPILKEALQDAMEVATKNVPQLPGHTYVFPDVSGSMTWAAATGSRGSATSEVKCVDIAALVASAILRTSPLATVIPVDTRLHTNLHLNPRDSVMTNAKKLAACGGGGTNLGLGLAHLAQSKAEVDTIIFVTDNESWAGGYYGYRGNATTGSETYWQQIKSRNPKAKLVCLQIQPYAHTQVADERDSVLNIGGFSDQCFTVIERFVTGADANFWVEEIEKISLG